MIFLHHGNQGNHENHGSRQKNRASGGLTPSSWQTTSTPPRKKILNGEQEAQAIALRLSDPPNGRNSYP